MKKLLILFLGFGILILGFPATSSGQLLIGSRAGGMGGVGVSSVSDLTAAYYNPAALMKSDVKTMRTKTALGAQYTDPTDLIDAISKSSNPASFISNNYSKAINFTGNLDGVIGCNIRKVGLSVLPLANVTANKVANSMIGTVNGTGQYAGVLTLGRTFKMGRLPEDVSVGINAKYITAYAGNITTTGTVLSASGLSTYSTGTGMGFDIGALTSIRGVNVGIVARDLAQSIKYTNKSRTSYVNFNGTTATVTNSAETALPDTTTNIDPSYAIGISKTIPGINLLLATDYETTSAGGALHVGAEFSLFNRITLRAGMASGANLAKTTLGTIVDLPIFSIDGVVVSDANNPGATTYIIDISSGW